MNLFRQEISCGVLKNSPVIFGSVWEGVLEILDEHMGVFCVEVMAIIRAHILSESFVIVELLHSIEFVILGV